MHAMRWAAGMLLLACCAAGAGAQPEGAGTVVAVEGAVQIRRGADVFDAKIRDPIYPKDVIRTSPAGRIKIFFDPSGTMTTIAEDSEVTITDSYFRGGIWKALFSLGSGRIRLDIEQAFGRDVEVVTSNAIAGAKGTGFVVRYDPREDCTTLLVLDGRVTFGNKAAEILVAADQWSAVRGLRPPLPAAEATAEIRRREAFELRTQGGRAGIPPPVGGPGAPGGLRTVPDDWRVRGARKATDNPQVDALTQTGAFIQPGSLVVSPGVPPAPPAPPRPPSPPVPPKPAPPSNPPGGGGGPF